MRILKQKHTELFPQARMLVNSWDPVGFIGSRAPSDEYDCITLHLLELLEQGKQTDQIYEFIIQELYDHFGMGLNSVKEEHIGAYIKKHKDFSSNLKAWYKEVSLHS
ncbi:hypothetical protein [Paenibacillus sp. sgz5001063]|uniref:hypothetical protein n=1 Tax=Paenibacillus sp. sgz5001063 TaxID=3242474 RepID=UPI0036D27DDC